MKKKSYYDKYENKLHDADDLIIDQESVQDKYEDTLRDGDDLLIDTPVQKENRDQYNGYEDRER